jgi:hypothetical protein
MGFSILLCKKGTMSTMLRFVDAAPVIVELYEVSLHVQLANEHLGAPGLILQLVQIVL